MAEVTYATSAELPSKAELQQIGQMREACRGEINTLSCRADDIVGDLRLCRFLRSRHGHAGEATEWFRDFLRWRVESGMDLDRRQVIGRSPEDMLEWLKKRQNPYFSMCPYAGRNADGHVIWFMRPGTVDPRKFVEHRQISRQEDLKTISLVLEWTLWHLNTLSRREKHMVYVVKVSDFGGLGAEGRKLPIFVPEFKAFMLEMMKGMQKYYCEHDSMFVQLNAPFAFRALFAVVKLMLTKRQVAKMRMLGDTSQADVRAALRQIVPEDLLPVEYGGPIQRLQGAFPLPTPVEIEEWYQQRHLVPVELAPSEVPPPAGRRREAPEPEAEASPGDAAPARTPGVPPVGVEQAGAGELLGGGPAKSTVDISIVPEHPNALAATSGRSCLWAGC